MIVSVEATYEKGQLKLKAPLALTEGAQVRVTITPVEDVEDPLADMIGIVASGRTDGAENHDKYLYPKHRP